MQCVKLEPALICDPAAPTSCAAQGVLVASPCDYSSFIVQSTSDAAVPVSVTGDYYAAASLLFGAFFTLFVSVVLIKIVIRQFLTVQEG